MRNPARLVLPSLATALIACNPQPAAAPASPAPVKAAEPTAAPAPEAVAAIGGAKPTDPGHECTEPAEAAVLVHAGAAAPAGAPQPTGKVYGAGVGATEVVAVSTLLADVDAWVGKKVRVEGLVADVCPMRGCWFEMAGDKAGTSVRFKVRDGDMVFPLSAKGQFAVAEGVVRKIPLDLETSRRYMAHQAEEKSEPFDPASVTAPITIVRLDGVGAVLRDAL